MTADTTTTSGETSFDFSQAGYQTMPCVEIVNAADGANGGAVVSKSNTAATIDGIKIRDGFDPPPRKLQIAEAEVTARANGKFILVY